MAVNVSATVTTGSVDVSAQIQTRSVSTSATVNSNNAQISANVNTLTPANVSASVHRNNVNLGANVNPHITIMSDHSRLSNLGYDESCHTGFQRELIPDESITIDEEGHIHANGESYTAGQNINIDENNIISAVDTTYTQGNGITIDQDNVISNDIYPLVPSQATSSNQLADKDFVNSSIATSTATFRGTYNVVTDLHLSTSATHQQVATALGNTISVADNNDYCFVEIPTDDLTPTETLQVDRYKYNGSAWSFEYTLNNSGYTSAQWKAINSGITSGKVSTYEGYATSKQDTLIAGTNITIGADGKTISSDIPQATSQVAGKVLLGAAGGAATYESVGDGKPICYPTTASKVGTTSMVVKSSVSDNGKILTENGFVYNTSGNPTISDNKVICDLGVGFMEKVLENLTQNTEYHIKSYGQNSSGISYGSELVQMTLLSPIPAEYQLVEYLESSGTQYIDTYYMFNVGDKININFSTLSLPNYGILFGSGIEFQCFLKAGTSDGFLTYGFSNNVTKRVRFSSFVNYEINIENNLCYLNGVNISNFVYFGNTDSTLSMSLFTRNNGHIYITPLQIKEFIVKRNNILYFALYPVYRIADNKPGMYDIVNNVFYTNQGTGEFIVGPDKEWDE